MTSRAKFPLYRPRKPAPNSRLTARKRRHGLRRNLPPGKTAVPLPQVPHTPLPTGHQKTRKPTPNDDEYVYLIKNYNEDNKSGEKTDYETERHTFMQKAQAETKLSHIVCWDADDDNPHGNISEPIFRITKDGRLFAGCTTRYEENTMVVHEVEKRSWWAGPYGPVGYVLTDDSKGVHGIFQSPTRAEKAEMRLENRRDGGEYFVSHGMRMQL